MVLEEFRDTIYTCNRVRCGFCCVECPAYKLYGFETYAAKGRNLLLRAIVEKTLKIDTTVSELLYKCTMCGYCKERCGQDLMKMSQAIRQELVECGLVPQKVQDFLNNISKHGNPWKLPRKTRGEWTQGTEIRNYKSGDEFLYYVGCTGSYDERGIRIARALGEVLLESDVSFGILGSDETCDGNDVKTLGEEGLFQCLADENIHTFKKLGVKKIVALSPHAFNVIRNYYPVYGGDFEVMHYTQLLWKCIENGKLKFSRFNKRITYHDPCFLGRYNDVYEPPRKILQAIPGIELVEMKRNRTLSFCCGGGGGNFFTDLLGGGDNSPNRIRVREAYDTGAEILAVACPNCMTMLENAVKDEGLEGKITVKDISEISEECLRT
jgi:Fe-S oxidoreductase